VDSGDPEFAFFDHDPPETCHAMDVHRQKETELHEFETDFKFFCDVEVCYYAV